MITMTPEVLHSYTCAIKKMDPNHERVLQERGAYERKSELSWFEEHAHEYTAVQLSGMLRITVASVRTKAYRLGITLAKAHPLPKFK